MRRQAQQSTPPYSPCFTRLCLCAAMSRYILVISVLLHHQLSTAQPATTSALKATVSFNRVLIDDHSIAYAQSGNPSGHGVLFIHGTPGDWTAFEGYLRGPELQNDFFLVSVDRLGWGNSPLPSNKLNGDFDLQSRAISAILNLYPNKKWTLVGHSLGASIAPQIALDNPSSVSSLVLLAGSLNPSLGGPRWYNRAANTWLVANLIGKSMKHSNREIMSLRKQLTTMDARIKSGKNNSRIVVMQGEKDKLVSPKNPAYAIKQWSPHFASISVVTLKEEGHFLPWRQKPLVIKSIYDLNFTIPK